MFIRKFIKPDIRNFSFEERDYFCFKCGKDIGCLGKPYSDLSYLINVSSPSRFEFLCNSCLPPKPGTLSAPGKDAFSEIVYATNYGRVNIEDKKIESIRDFKLILSTIKIINRKGFSSITLYIPDMDGLRNTTLGDVLNGLPLENINGIKKGCLYTSLNKTAKDAWKFWQQFGKGSPFVGDIWDKRQCHFDFIRGVFQVSIDLISQFRSGGVAVWFYSMNIVRVSENCFYSWISSRR